MLLHFRRILVVKPPWTRCLSAKVPQSVDKIKKVKPSTKIKRINPHASQVLKYFAEVPRLSEIKPFIPPKHLQTRLSSSIQHLYLIDKKIASSVVSHVLPVLKENKEQILCETNAGVGFVTAELLDNGVQMVRIYESCPEFRQTLKHFDQKYPKRMELFIKDIFNIGSLSIIDKKDGGNRVQQILKGVPKRNWSDDPVMTIIGSMPDLYFIRYILQMIGLQQEIALYGRIQIFALMRPKDFLMLTATAGMSLNIYKVMSILFQLFFEYKLLDKYSRKSFVPWERKLQSESDPDSIYLVQINLKKCLPTEKVNLLHLYHFVKQGFLRGRNKIIPQLEMWLPGIGIELIAPPSRFRKDCYPNMNIYTEFGELTPTQIMCIFRQMLEHPGYKSSPFIAVVESMLLKYETVASDTVIEGSSLVQSMQEI